MPSVSNTPSPSSLEEWRQLLKYPLLPVDPAIKSAALQKLKSSSGNTNNVAAILQYDPALCLLLFHAANKGLSHGNNEALSPAHAISLLGFPRVIQLISQSPDWKAKPFPQLNAYRQQLSVSLHGARLTQYWAELNPHWSATEVFWPSLLLQAPLWALWHQAGTSLLTLQQQQVVSAGANHDSIEQQILGCSLQQLSQSLSKDWHLPKLCQQARQTGTAGSPRQWLAMSHSTNIEQKQSLQQVAKQPGFLIALANHLANETEWNGYSRRSLRLQKILAVVLKQPLPHIIALIHQQTINSARQVQISGSFSPALQLFSYYQKAQQLQTQKSTPASLGKIPSKTVQQAQKNGATESFIAALKQLEDVESFNNLQQLINFVVQQLQQHAGFERVSAMMLNRKTKTLETICSSGCEQSPALQNFTHNLHKGDLFNKLLQKTLSVQLQAANYSKIWPLLPGSFKQACATDEFMMMSILIAGRPLGIFYADCGVSNSKLSEQQYEWFKQLCNTGLSSIKIILAKPNSH